MKKDLVNVRTSFFFLFPFGLYLLLLKKERVFHDLIGYTFV